MADILSTNYLERLARDHINDYGDSLPEAQAEWEDPVMAKRSALFTHTMAADERNGPTYQIVWEVKLPHRPALSKLYCFVTGLDQVCTVLRNRGSSVTEFQRELEKMRKKVSELKYTSYVDTTPTVKPAESGRLAIKHSK